MFLACPMRISIIVFHIGNDYGRYTRAEKDDFSFLDHYGFSEEDKTEIITEYKDSHKEQKLLAEVWLGAWVRCGSDRGPLVLLVFKFQL